MPPHSILFPETARVHPSGRSRYSLFAGTAVSTMLMSMLAWSPAASAGCLVIGNGIPCTGVLNNTVDAGNNDNIVYVYDATGSLTVNGDGGNDGITITGSTLTSKDSSTLVNAGIGVDGVTIQGSSNVTGDILGSDGEDSLLVEGASTVTGDLNGGADNDLLSIRGASTVNGSLVGAAGDDVLRIYQFSSEGASTLSGDMQGGTGNDSIYVQNASTVTGDLLGDEDNDTIVVQDASTVESDILGGTGLDAVTVQGGSTVEGSIYGEAGDDTIVVEEASDVDGDVDSGSDADSITLRGASTIGGDVLGGSGNDTISINDAAIDGTLGAGDGNDTVAVLAGSIDGGITTGAGNDAVTIYGGTVSGFGGGHTIVMGAGDDTLDIINLNGTGNATLDISGIAVFEGEPSGTSGADIAHLVDLNDTYSQGGLFDRQFIGWSEVYAVNSLLELDSDNTISALSITQGSTLYQTDGSLALLNSAGLEAASLTVDGTSIVEMREGALPSGGSPFLLVLPVPAADDSISVAQLNLTGQENPLSNPTLGVDFDADNQADQTGRDDAPAGNADQIDVSISIVRTGTVGIDINTFGGYLGSGLPTTLSGSVAIIDDQSSAALANPGIGARLQPSTGYVTNDLFRDPARRWALVDQGDNGVSLQWTTPVNTVTVGPNAGADLASAWGASGLLSGIMTGFADGSMARKDYCVQPTADAPGNACEPRKVSVWVQGSGGHTSLESGGNFAGFDATSYDLSIGVDYAFSDNLKAGVFGSYLNSSVDLGKVNGAFGQRSSNADLSSGFGGVYVDAAQGAFYFNGVGLLGRSHTNINNGALLFATSDYDGWVGGLGATAGAKVDVAEGFALDPRVQASYLGTSTEDYSDSYGLGLDSSTNYGRLAATLGLVFGTDASPFGLTVRGGAAYITADTVVNANEPVSGSHASADVVESLGVLTGSVDVSWKSNDRATLIATVSGDTGEDVHAYQGNLTFSYTLK